MTKENTYSVPDTQGGTKEIAYCFSDPGKEMTVNDLCLHCSKEQADRLLEETRYWKRRFLWTMIDFFKLFAFFASALSYSGLVGFALFCSFLLLILDLLWFQSLTFSSRSALLCIALSFLFAFLARFYSRIQVVFLHCFACKRYRRQITKYRSNMAPYYYGLGITVRYVMVECIQMENWCPGKTFPIQLGSTPRPHALNMWVSFKIECNQQTARSQSTWKDTGGRMFIYYRQKSSQDRMNYQVDFDVACIRRIHGSPSLNCILKAFAHGRP